MKFFIKNSHALQQCKEHGNLLVYKDFGFEVCVFFLNKDLLRIRKHHPDEISTSIDN